jgi:DNA polymerase-3 subunit delta'
LIFDTDGLLSSSQGWRELSAAVEAKRCPQSVSAAVPEAMQKLFVEKYGRLILGDGSLWKDGNHPDKLDAGNITTPPSIAECRTLHGELGLYPLAAQRRLAVIWCADKLSIEASNSLLKLTEEHPERGCVLFVSEENKLIPTIKSRVWPVRIDLPQEMAEAKPHPSTDEEWAEWLSSGKKKEPEVLCLEIESWIRDLVKKGDFIGASELDSMVRLMGSRRLSVPMIQDLAVMVIKEEVPFGKIFGDFR